MKQCNVGKNTALPAWVGRSGISLQGSRRQDLVPLGHNPALYDSAWEVWVARPREGDQSLQCFLRFWGGVLQADKAYHSVSRTDRINIGLWVQFHLHFSVRSLDLFFLLIRPTFGKHLFSLAVQQWHGKDWPRRDTQAKMFCQKTEWNMLISFWNANNLNSNRFLTKTKI